MVTRKNAKRLNPDEKAAFVAAFKTLKSAGEFDKYVQWHAIATATRNAEGSGSIDGAHRGPAFLAWHRAFLYALEKELQAVSGNPLMAIPYWDWTTDPLGTTVFTPEFMGGNGHPDDNDAVTDGPFAQGLWTTVSCDFTCDSLRDNGPLRRAFGVFSLMPTEAAVRQVMFGSTVYDSFPWNSFANPSFRADIENQLHNRVHLWVGGHMSDAMIAPNDPIFFLHHSNIDRLWARWQGLYPSATYLPQSGLPAGQNLNDQLLALTQAPAEARTPAQVWDYRALGYEYDRAPGLRLVNGVSSTDTGAVESTDIEITLFASVPTGPAGTWIVRPGLSGWDLGYTGSDHHVGGAGMKLNIQTERLPPQISFLAGLWDNDANKHSMEATASLLFITEEVTS